MKIPFNDLRAQYQTIKSEVDTAIADVVASCAFVGGPAVDRFEQQFAEYCQCKHSVGVASGTAALQMALAALDIGAGDEVITTPYTFIATTEAITHSGATLRLVDCLEGCGTIDPALFEKAITPRTKAVIPVHIYGQPADMDPILEIAARHGVTVIEDAAQAHGALYKGRRAGSMGRIACFSFYPGKNLGCYGDGGAVTTNDAKLAERVRLLRDHGRSTKYEHAVEGYNSRLDGIQGAVLEVKLRHLEDWTEVRRRFAARYDALFAGSEVRPLKPRGDDVRHVYHLYVVRVPNREEVLPLLHERGVGAGVHYPMPLHLQKAYAYLGFGKGSFPVAEKLSAEVVSLPIYAEMDEKAPEYVAATLKELVGARA
jgi:dTDP-4-amino-4,6-dideoxygalactose transaminase